ncbi:hypothetical protein H8E52_12615 [bacterium]|nr:hypothetical protein [bacterium]
MKTVLKSLISLVLILVLLLVGLVALLFFPQPLFAEKLELEGLTLYADTEISSQMQESAREALQRISAIEGLDPNRGYRAFYCESHRRYAFLSQIARLNPNSQGFGLYYAGNMFISEKGLAANERLGLEAIPFSRFEGSMAHVIAHEAAHFVHVRRYGFRDSQALPIWKTEGFADWGATVAIRANTDRKDFLPRMEMLQDDQRWNHEGYYLRRFLKWQLMAEYHFDVCGRSQEAFFDSSLREEDLWVELSNWIAEGKSS